jgi:hypothetical protein
MAQRTRAPTDGRAKAPRAVVGIADHAGFAIAVTASAAGALVDRRRLELVDATLPAMPHHHEGQRLPIAEAVALVARVRASALRNAAVRLAELESSIGVKIDRIALRECPPLPTTVAERITSYRAMCVADWVMYREALADAAKERGWTVSWYDAKAILTATPVNGLTALLAAAKKKAGPPWQKDHRVAMAAALAAAVR